MTHTVCEKCDDAKVMELMMTFGTRNVYNTGCPHSELIRLTALYYKLRGQLAYSYNDCHLYRNELLSGCQRCRYYKGEYPKQKE